MDKMKNTTVMTREEAIERLEWYQCHAETKEDADAFDMAISALRPISQGQVEKVWRGEWVTPTIIGGRAYNIPHCSACNGVPCRTYEHTRFCAHCGAPMTDEAVDMVMKRLEVLKVREQDG